jgi:hypothetical protein
MPGQGFVLGAQHQVSDNHLYSLQLPIFGRDGAHLIGDLLTFHWNILPFHVRAEQENVLATVGWGDEAMALGPAETLADSFVDRALGNPHCPGDTLCSAKCFTPLGL